MALPKHGMFMCLGVTSGSINCSLRRGSAHVGWPFSGQTPDAYLDPFEANSPGLSLGSTPRDTPWNCHWGGIYSEENRNFDFDHVRDSHIFGALLYWDIPANQDMDVNRALVSAMDTRLRGGSELVFGEILKDLGVPPAMKARFSNDRNVNIGGVPDATLKEIPTGAAGKAVLSENAKLLATRAQYTAFRAKKQEEEAQKVQENFALQQGAMATVNCRMWNDQMMEVIKEAIPFVPGASPETSRALSMLRDALKIINILESPALGLGVQVVLGQEEVLVQGIDLAEVNRRAGEASTVSRDAGIRRRTAPEAFRELGTHRF